MEYWKEDFNTGTKMIIIVGGLSLTFFLGGFLVHNHFRPAPEPATTEVNVTITGPVGLPEASVGVATPMIGIGAGMAAQTIGETP